MLFFLLSFRGFATGGDQEGNLLKALQTASQDTSKVNAMIKLANFYVNKPGEDEKDMALALVYAGKIQQLSRRNGFLRGSGAYYVILALISKEKGRREESRKYALEAIKIFQKSPSFNAELADAYLELSNSYDLSSDAEVKNKIRYHHQGIDILKKSFPNSIKLADALKFLGDLYNVDDDDVKSAAFLTESLAIYKAIHYEKLQDIYALLGAVLSHMGNTGEGMKYLLLATKTADKFNDRSSTVVTLYNRIGTVYNGMNQLDNAIRAFRKSLSLAEFNKDKDAILLVSSNLSWTLIRQNRSDKAIAVLKNALKSCAPSDTAQNINLHTTLIEAYVRTGQLGEAVNSYKKINRMIKSFYTYDFLQVNYYHATSKLFLALKDYTKMSSSIDSFQVASNKTKSIRDFAGVQYLSFKLDSALGKPWEAIEHFKKFKILGDSLNDRNHDKELARFQTEFESERKDIEIVSKAKHISSLKSQSALQKRALNGERMSRNLLICGVVLLAMLLGLGYNRFLIKKNANKELEGKQIAINAQNLSLKQLLIEREWLLKEIHHRVKNNLQIIISLLDSQSVFLTDDSALGVIRESQHRMNCISLVHQKLYQDDNLAGIEMQDYIYELISYMKDTFGTAPEIRFVQDIDRLVLDVSQAVPLGLILNEGITNALKYAFSGSKDCVLSIKLKVSGGVIDLVIQDNGCGLPEYFDINNCSSLGMSLIRGLTKQLGGEIEFHNNNGLTINIKIPKLKVLSESNVELEMDHVA